MNRITADSTVEEVMMELGVGEGEELRESSKRQKSLEKFAQMRSRNPNTTLTLRNVPTAFVKVDEELEEFVDITVTTKRFDQTVTELPPKYSDYLVQKAMTVHEIGHILYSDWEALKHFSDKVKEDEQVGEEGTSEAYQVMFKNFFNILEDGAIENFLSEDFRVEEELTHLRATIHENLYMGDERKIEGETIYQYPMFYAIATACLNIAVYDNGELDKLLDEDNDKHVFPPRGGKKDKEMFENDCLPLIRQGVNNILNEPDAYNRSELIYNLWTEMVKFIKRSQTDVTQDFKQRQKMQDSDSYVPGVPENMSEGHGDQKSKPVMGGEGGNEEVKQGKSRGDKAKTPQENGRVGSKAEQGLRDETVQESGDWSDEIEEIINALGAGDGIDEIAIAEDGTVNQDRKQEAKNLSRKTSRLFARRLRMLKKDKVVRNKERGEFDSRALIPAEMGSTRAFMQTKKADTKNYSCMIILDRSGSMSRKIEKVELAAGAIAWGLEDNGVDTCIIDTESGMTTLSKPFGTTTDSFTEKVFAGRCGGGTPLQYTMGFARDRMKRGAGDYPFAIVITDGGVHGKKDFKDEVSAANFPILGLYIRNGKEGVEDQLSLYDKAVVCTEEDDVSERLMNLINSVMF